MQKVWTTWKLGFIAMVPLLVVVGILAWVLNWVAGLSYGFVENRYLNMFVNTLLIFLALPIVCGLLLGMRWLRNIGLAILGRLPLVGPLFSFVLNHDYVEKIQSGDLREAVFRYAGSSWSVCGVVNEFEAPEFWDHGPMIKWCAVLGPPTAPIAFTAPLLFVQKSDLIFTGRPYKSTILTTASFGFNFDVKEIAERHKKTYRSPAQGS